MWNFDAKKFLEEHNKRIHEVEIWQSDTQEKIKDLHKEILAMQSNLSLLQKNTTHLNLSPEQESRIQELEIWRSKIHSLFIEKTPAGKEKVSIFARKFRGRI